MSSIDIRCLMLMFKIRGAVAHSEAIGESVIHIIGPTKMILESYASASAASAASAAAAALPFSVSETSG